MLKIGHRGACGYAPENTLSSFKKALELSVDCIELDVHLSKDGSLVVIHDSKLDRTTNGQGYVVDKTLAELKQLDAGRGEKIPTLEEVLDLVDKKTKVNIELKGEKTAEPVTKIITEYLNKGWNQEDFLVSSFNHPELQKFKNLMSEINIGALITGIPLDLAKFGETLNAYSVNLSQEFIDQTFIDDAHRRNLKVYVYTVNDEDDIDQMKSLGVDGIFSNYPDRL